VDLQGKGAQTAELGQVLRGPASLAGRRIVIAQGSKLYDAVSLPASLGFVGRTRIYMIPKLEQKRFGILLHDHTGANVRGAAWWCALRDLYHPH